MFVFKWPRTLKRLLFSQAVISHSQLFEMISIKRAERWELLLTTLWNKTSSIPSIPSALADQAITFIIMRTMTC